MVRCFSSIVSRLFTYVWRSKWIRLLRRSIPLRVIRTVLVLAVLSLVALWAVKFSGHSRFLYDRLGVGRFISNQACIHPQLDPFNPNIYKYFKKLEPLKCDAEEDWVYVQNGTYRIAASAKKKHGNIKCTYKVIGRGHTDPDFSITYGSPKSFKDGDPLESDFSLVECEGEDASLWSKSKWKSLISGIAQNPELLSRFKSNALPKSAMGYNVLMFGFDSVSRMNWLRNLKNTAEYFTKTLGGIALEGYNIVGDGTPAALLPILTGLTEDESPESRRGIPGAVTLDGYSFIWKDFKKLGYVTQWAEQSPNFGTFQLRMLGFNQPPVDHYSRPFYMALEELSHPKFCLGSKPIHINMMDWAKDAFLMYGSRPKFLFSFHSDYSHDDLSNLQWADADLKAFLEYLETHGYLTNTIVILMADHGARFLAARRTVQGKLEERMPYFAFRFPDSFRVKYPDAWDNFRVNAHKLTTPFDIYETLRDIVDYRGAGRGSVSNRGISLFKEIPEERTCAHAGIARHWCACLDWKKANPKDASVKKAILTVLSTINGVTKKYRDRCEELSVFSVNRTLIYSPNVDILKFQGSADYDGRIPDLGDDTVNNAIVYQIDLITKPGLGHYEATVYHNRRNGEFRGNIKEISRINKYGSQADCIANDLPHLRQFCYCKDKSR